MNFENLHDASFCFLIIGNKQSGKKNLTNDLIKSTQKIPIRFTYEKNVNNYVKTYIDKQNNSHVVIIDNYDSEYSFEMIYILKKYFPFLSFIIYLPILHNYYQYFNLFRFVITHIFLIHSKTIEFPYFPYEPKINLHYFHCFIYDKLDIHSNFTWKNNDNLIIKNFTFPLPKYVEEEKIVSIFSITSKLLKLVNHLIQYYDESFTYNELNKKLNEFLFSDVN